MTIKWEAVVGVVWLAVWVVHLHYHGELGLVVDGVSHGNTPYDFLLTESVVVRAVMLDPVNLLAW